MKESLPIDISRLSPKANLDQLARLYAEVFAGPPWNEFTECSTCEKFFGLETKSGDSCVKCGNLLTLAYPLEETKSYIQKETNRLGASAFVMRKGSELISFCWGFSYLSVDDFVADKYRTPKLQANLRRLLILSGINSNFFYFSECGVRDSERGQGFSNQLSKLILEEAVKQKLPVILRTNFQSPMVAVSRRFNLRQIMGPEVEVDQSSKLLRATGGIVNNCLDSEISERVLFIKPFLEADNLLR